MKRKAMKHEFVDTVPETVREGVLYVSIEYSTAVHLCACGCGQEVVTPISPTDWKLIFDGDTVSLDPSVGNWSFPCRSHYWIRRNRVRWSGQMSEEEIAAVRDRDAKRKAAYFGKAAKEKQHRVSESRPTLAVRLASWLGLR